MAQKWYCHVGGKQYGPLTAQQLKQLAAAGKLRPKDGVRRETDKKWTPAAQVKGLFAESPAPANKTATAETTAKKATPDKPKSGRPASDGDELPPLAPLESDAASLPRAKPLSAAGDDPTATGDDDDEFQLKPLEPLPGPSATASTGVRPVGTAAARPMPATTTPAPLPAAAAGSQLADDGLNYFRVMATAATGAALGFAALCLAKVPILPILAGGLGLLFAIRAFAMSKSDRNVIGLCLVASVLSLVGGCWGLMKTIDAADPIKALQYAFGLAAPETPKGTLRAGEELGELDSVTVRLRDMAFRRVPGVANSKLYFVMGVTLENESASEAVTYQSWSIAEQGAVLRDARGKAYEIIHDGRIDGQQTRTTIEPGGRAGDVLVFQAPAGLPDKLFLKLPGQAVGSTKEVVFEILREDIAIRTTGE
ncbi:MAG: DUF4339 domain-containing protein [Planctomycetota bacterium]|nr:MAG: DUF4339 domain-containing protein [Planctomycetota bacterium]REK47960.1 MAG: DUF4339 domain-containing protein [Planctomycetota bacterium]